MEQNEHETHRVIVLDRTGARVLLEPKGQHHVLPRVEFPGGQRMAENITIRLKREWGTEVVVLFELPTTNDGPRHVAAEYLCTRFDSNLPRRWVPVSALSQDSLLEACDQAAIEQVLRICEGKIEAKPAGPFSGWGWFRDLRNWVDSVIEPMGFHLTGEFRQVNASASFSLIRFETDGPGLWFKAVGEPNLREFPITCALAQLFPRYLSPIVATRFDWNAWLSREIQGKILSEIQEQTGWEKAASALARLQIESINRGSQILAAGAHDLGSVALSNLIGPFMSFMARLMEPQTKVPPAVLNRADLLRLADSLQHSVDAMDAISIPPTLGHLDLNPGNIIISDGQCTFLDWAEANISNPLFSLEYLLQHARRTFGERFDLRTKMLAAYCAEWDGVVSPAAIANALVFAPLLAVFAYAAGTDAWRQAEELEEPTAGYLRSLARRMHREARGVADRRAVCLE